MDRIRFVEHKGDRILLLDFSGIDDADLALKTVQATKAFVAEQPEKSLLILTYVKDSTFNLEVGKAMWQLAVHDKPYTIAGAVVGLSPVQANLYHLVNRISKRRIANFGNLEQAKDWLVEQRPAAV